MAQTVYNLYSRKVGKYIHLKIGLRDITNAQNIQLLRSAFKSKNYPLLQNSSKVSATGGTWKSLHKTKSNIGVFVSTMC